MKYFLKQLRFVKFRDILACFVFLIALPISWIYKIKRKNIWLVCERASEARDNGYWFYKFLCEKHPEIDKVYAIKSDSPDYEKVKCLSGEVIEFGSFKHWVYYLAADINISSQKEGKPNAAVCHFLEIYGLRKNRRVYLKHGIVCNDLKWHYYDVTKMWLYVCTTQKEFEFCKEKFGYPDDTIVLTGLCRFDNLVSTQAEQKTVFIMPTHREWLSRPIKDFEQYDDVFCFENTEYYKSWVSVLENEKFNKCIEDNELDVIFFLHPAVQKYSDSFNKISTKAKIMRTADIDLQDMMKKSHLMITDYSSVSFDFAYMKKPLIYYQFDIEKFREGHYQEGYFSYEYDGFGPVCTTEEEMCDAFCNAVRTEFKMPEKYADRVNKFFYFTDTNNCERVFEAIIKHKEKDSK